jgi:outer membrane protein assembly factor BamE
MQKKPMFIRFLPIVALLTIGGVTGCSYLKFPGVYRIAVLQGNIIDQKKVDQLKVGMSRRQVQYVMGSPLINDIFHEDRWDYVYQVRKGDEVMRDRRFTVYFEDDKLVRFEGDFEPSEITTDTYIEDAEEA